MGNLRVTSGLSWDKFRVTLRNLGVPLGLSQDKHGVTWETLGEAGGSLGNLGVILE